MSVKIKVQGAVHQIGQTQTFASGFRKRTLVVKQTKEPGARYDDYLAFDFLKDRTADLDKLRVGEPVEVEAYVDSRENQQRPGQWFTGCRAASVKKMAVRTVDIPLAAPEPPDGLGDEPDGGDDMPF